jgi:acetyl-CoA carboxylase biotin carboxyl carrier protein
MHLTNDDVREILRLLDESPYDELKLQTDNFSLTLKRTTGKNRRPQTASRKRRKKIQTAETPKPVDVEPPKKKKAPKSRPVRQAAASGEVFDVYPPLPGIFYRAPQPGAEPFVDIGSAVEEHTVVGLIETMKLMNSVMAGCAGEVMEFCTDNGVMVEAGDVLLRIRTSK